MADKNDELATKLTNWFENSETQSAEARKLAERDRDYRDNKQWTPEEVEELGKRNQPVITINRIARKVMAFLGIERQQRTDPRAFPRNPEDEDSAHAATDAIRFVIDNNNYDQIRSGYWENLIVEGIGAVKVSIKEGKRGVEILLKRIPWDRFFYDPHSSEPDFSDAKYLGEVIWMDLEDAEAKWPDGGTILTATMSTDTGSDTYADKPNDGSNKVVWADKKASRVRIIQTRWKDKDGWHITTSTKGGILKDDISPFLDDEDLPESDLLAISAFIDRDNARYGPVREMISPQDEINKRRSKALHLMSVRQVRIDPQAEVEIESLRTELSKPDAVFRAEKDEFEILDNSDMATAQFNLLQEAKNEIENMGPSPILQGKEQRDLSGRAILAQQQAGLVEMSLLLDRKRNMDIRVYRTIWNRIKQFWNEERWVRVTDDENAPKFVGLNRQMTVGEVFEKEFGGIPDDADPAVLQEPAQMPDGSPIIENNVGQMDIDIILDEGPDNITIQAEQFEQLVKLASSVPIPPDVLIEASSLRNKDKLIEKLTGGGEDVDPEVLAQQQAEQQQIKDLQMAGAIAEVEKTQAETEDKLASADERESKTVLNMVDAQQNRG